MMAAVNEALTNTKISYLLVILFCNLVLPLFVYICAIKFFGCAIGLVSGIAKKSGYGFPKIINQAELFLNICSF